MTDTTDPIAKLLHESRIKRDAAAMALADGNHGEHHRLRKEGRDLEAQANAMDPSHLNPSWRIEQ